MKSKNFKEFKNIVGQSNHFLITLLIGLDAIENGARKNDSFKTSWEPKDIQSTVLRSRKFALNSSMSWVVDNLDAYLRSIDKKPYLIPEKFCESFKVEKIKRSVYRKYEYICQNIPNLDDNKKAFVDLLITWRNNTIHFSADNTLKSESLNYFIKLSGHDNEITKYNIDVAEMLKRFNNNDGPTFKEVATMISMTLNFVSQLDQILLNQMKQDKYLKELLSSSLTHYEIKSFFSSENNDLDSNNMHFIKRKKRIFQYLITKGFDICYLDSIGEEYINRISKLNINEAFQEFLTSS